MRLYRRGSAYSASLGYTELREQSYTGLCMADERALQNRLGRARGKNVGKDLFNIPTKSPMS